MVWKARAMWWETLFTLFMVRAFSNKHICYTIMTYINALISYWPSVHGIVWLLNAMTCDVNKRWDVMTKTRWKAIGDRHLLDMTGSAMQQNLRINRNTQACCMLWDRGHAELARLLTNYNWLLITDCIKKTVVSNIILIICKAIRLLFMYTLITFFKLKMKCTILIKKQGERKV